MTLHLTRAEELDSAAIRSVARGQRLLLDDQLRERLAARRREVLAALADGRRVYGVNTAMGARSDVTLSADAQARHQQNLLLARAVGGPPWLSAVEVRALYAVRLRTFLSGDAGVSPALLDALIAALDAGLVPAVPRSGYGSAGEIIPLAHAFGPLVGVGAVRQGSAAVDAAVDAAVGLQAAQLVPISLGPKEGIALLQGIPGATARAVVLAGDVARLVDQAITVFALGLAAVAAPRDPYLAEVARGDREQAAISAAIRDRLVGTEATPRVMQAAVSFRVAAAVLAHVSRCLAALEAAIERALAAVSDSPVLIDGEFRGTAGFHGLDLAAHLDQLAVALVHAAEVSAARTHRMLDARFSGLAPQLADAPAATGLVVVHKRAAGVVHQLRRATLSSVVGTTETSFGQEDVQAFGWEAAGNAREAMDGAVEVLACELLVATQALRLSDRVVGAPLQSAVASVAAVVPPIDGDRPFGADIEALRRLLIDGRLRTDEVAP
ncbi:aromatic amino acid ammonia-lyase [Jatrophihabitans sp.]|uniref:aromatic amino acid ammonia-lyase n=1 Tax=Jatrophihabitans sp. TaxID=1932789 RepID=UPI0030C75D8C|nr:phenylalanine/histidine ammonia-lyase [Jatrophihabitans sp.]